jgi:iron complex outermembrane recepter protein
MKNSCRPLAHICAFVFLPLALFAQTLPPPTKPAAAADEKAVELNPFVVSDSADTGYLASNTLAGSRMNTELRNVANTVSVFTPEFISDLGATTIEELMEYGLNTQVDLGAGDFNFQGDQNSVADGIGTQKNFRVRGQESSVSMEYFGQAGPLDTYNLDRVELSSGPNAILFGTGAAGGLLNMSIKRPNFRRGSLQNKLVFGSFAERRVSTDINLPVVKDFLAFRMQALHGKEHGWQRLGFKNTDRGTFSILVKPFKKTEITASLEHGQIDQSKNSVASTALDSMGQWLALRATNGGRGPLTTFAQVTALGAAPAFAQFGVASVDRHHYTLVTNDGFSANFRRGVETRSILNNAPKSALAPTVMAPDINYYGPASRQKNRFRNLTVKVDQQITRDLYAQASFFDSVTNAGATFPPLEDNVYADANAVLPNADGTPGTAANPYAGRLYMEDNWAQRTHNEADRVYRGTLAYQFAPRNYTWLVGKHRLAGLIERHESDVVEDNLLEVWDIWSAVPAAQRAAFTTTYGFNFNNPEAVNNQIWRRNYLTEGNYESYFAGDYRTPAATTVGGFALRPKFVTTNAQDHLSLVTTSKMIATQSAFWKERVHLTLGYRSEKTDATQAIAVRDTSNTAAVGNPFVRTFDGTIPKEFSTITRTFGIVYHVLPRLSVFYNSSSNANSPNLRRNVFPEGAMGPPRRGKGDDIGFALELFDRKLYLRGARFTNQAENGGGTFEVTPDVATPNANLWDMIETLQNQAIAAGRISASHPALVTGPTLESYRVRTVDGDVFDEDSRGYEFQIIGNPTPAWRVSLNYGYSTRRRTNVLKLALDYEKMVRAAAEKWEKEFAAATGQTTPVVVNQATGRTIAEVYDRMELEVEETKSNQEDFAFNSRPHKVNLFTTYRFTQGWARGFRLGGGVVYQSPVITGRFFYYHNSTNGAKSVTVAPYNKATSPTQMLDSIESIPGEAIYRVDLTTGYTRRVEFLGRKSTLSLQLNVHDLFDWNNPSARRYRPVGNEGGRIITRYNVYPPRTWRVTAGLDF